MNDMECPQCHHAWRDQAGVDGGLFVACPGCNLYAARAVFAGLASLHAHGLRSPWEVGRAGK